MLSRHDSVTDGKSYISRHTAVLGYPAQLKPPREPQLLAELSEAAEPAEPSEDTIESFFCVF